MGEETKLEQPVIEARTEEKPVEEKKEGEQPSPPPEEKKNEEQPPSPEEEEEEKKEEEPPQAPAPFVLYVDLHCTGCAKKIQKCIMKIRGVEGVVTDMGKKQVTIKGGVVEPETICKMIMKKSKRKAQVLSPLPASQAQPLPQLVTSQVSGSTTVDLNVNMHCQACADQLKKKILKMRGVQTAETELSSGKVTVTGTMDADKLVDYVYRHTKKTARIVPQLEPEPEPQPPPEEPKQADEPNPSEGEKKEDKSNQAPPDQSSGGDQPPPEEAPKEGDGEGGEAKETPPPMPEDSGTYIEEDSMKRMVYYPYNYQPLYFIERIPPPQLFSDENPNACCIS